MILFDENTHIPQALSSGSTTNQREWVCTVRDYIFLLLYIQHQAQCQERALWENKYWKDGSSMQWAACWALKGTCGISEESLWMAHTEPSFSSSLPWSHEAEGHNTFLISKTYMKPLYTTIYHKPTHTQWQTAHYIMTPQEVNHNTKPQLFSFLRFLGLN